MNPTKTNDPNRFARPPTTSGPSLAPPQPPIKDLKIDSIQVGREGHPVTLLQKPAGDDAESRRLWALGLIASAPNNSPLYGTVSTEDRAAACEEIKRLARLPERVRKGEA